MDTVLVEVLEDQGRPTGVSSPAPVWKISACGWRTPLATAPSNQVRKPSRGTSGRLSRPRTGVSSGRRAERGAGRRIRPCAHPAHRAQAGSREICAAADVECGVRGRELATKPRELHTRRIEGQESGCGSPRGAGVRVRLTARGRIQGAAHREGRSQGAAHREGRGRGAAHRGVRGRPARSGTR